MRRHIAFAYAALTAGCATHPQLGTTIDTPIETSIQAVRSNPSQFDGKYILVRGILDECTSFACDIRQVKPGASPKDSNAPSLSVTFKMGPNATAAPADNQVMSLSGELANRLYRFSEVTAVGQYAAKCDLGPAPAKAAADGDREEITICNDRGFNISRIMAVHKRWPATAFGSKDESLSVMSPTAAKGVFTSYIKAILAVNPEADIAEWKPPYRAFASKDEPDTAILCICRGKQCDGGWPSSLIEMISAPSNPYGCVEASRANGTWRFPPPSIEY
ncbi:MAG: hypothetical protein JWM91_2594 [Rhodospirillales bacterium]|nr:hypothetical protein [Rhodospirillales bacterium]